MYLKTKGLILRQAHYKDAHRILSVLTSDYGRLTLKARDVKRRSSRISEATQLFCFSELTVFESKGRHSITEAEIIEDFQGLRDDIESLSLASYFSELLEAVSDEDSPSPDVLRLGLNCLYALSRKLADPEIIRAAFEIKLMCIAGYTPELDCCAICGEAPVLPVFSSALGSVVCEGHDGVRGRRVSDSLLDSLRHIIDCRQKNLFSFSLDATDGKVLSRLAEGYVIDRLEREFRALNYYKSIKRG